MKPDSLEKGKLTGLESCWQKVFTARFVGVEDA